MPIKQHTKKRLATSPTNGGQRWVLKTAGTDRGFNLIHSFQQAHEFLHWDRPFKTVRAGGFATGDIVWFPEGGLNASYNCVDRWAFNHPNKVYKKSALSLLLELNSLSDRNYLRGG